MYHQNWLEEMDQIGCCRESRRMRTRGTTSFRNKNSSSSSNDSPSSCTTRIIIVDAAAVIAKSINKSSKRVIRISCKSEGGEGWRSLHKNSSSSLFAIFWLILSVGFSEAVMAYQNDLSAISTSSSGGSISGASTSNSASSSSNSRHGCIWSRTDGSSSSHTTATTTTATSSLNNNMYGGASPGNNPFHHQQQHSFPALSSPYPYHSSGSLQTSAFTGGSSSVGVGGAGGVLTLNCNVRTLNVDLQNYTGLFTREQIEQTNTAHVKCSDVLFFESFLSQQNQTLFKLRNLRNVQIENCKIRKLPKGVFSLWTQLKQLDIHSYNSQWSSAIGMEIEPGAFDGLSNLETLSLANSNVYMFPDPNPLCPMKKLVTLNLSGNSFTDNEFEGNHHCDLSVQTLDMSFNSLRRVSNFGFSKLRHIRLQHNMIEEIMDTAFQGLPLVRQIDISSNRLVAIPPTIFKANPDLGEINLSNNSLILIPGSIFEGLVRLIVLNLSFNQLTSIDSIFNDQISLQALYINNNKINYINPSAFQSLSNLHILDLSNNHLKNLDEKLFSNLIVLTKLSMDHNQLSNLHPLALKNATSLQDLGIMDNLFEEVPNAIQSVGFSLKTLDIGQNKLRNISNLSLLNLRALYGLRLTQNNIEELPEDLCDNNNMGSLRVLNLANNNLKKINFKCKNLRVLRLDSNLLEALPSTLPAHFENLLWLNVSSNRLQTVNFLSQTLEWVDLSHNEITVFASTVGSENDTITSSLRVLDLSFNKLQRLDFAIPPNLETLRLNNNILRNVAPNTFSRSTNLRRVDLRWNQLESLASTALRIPRVQAGNPLPEFYIAGNNFSCESSMEWLTRVNHQISVLRYHPKIVDIDAVYCRTPMRSNQLIPILEAPKDLFVSKYTEHCNADCPCCDYLCDCANRCPEGCNCYHDSSWSINIVECSNSNHTAIPTHIPIDVTHLYLDGNVLPVLNKHIFLGRKHLHSIWLNASNIEVINNKTFNSLRSLEYLQLSFNKISSIVGYEFEQLPNLIELHLSNNRISFIAKDSFIHTSLLRVLTLNGNLLTNTFMWEITHNNGYLNRVMIANNNWTCDCSFILEFRAWASKSTTDFAFAKCQPTQDQLKQLWPQQQDGNSNNSSAIMNSGGSTITPGGGSTNGTATVTPLLSITHPTISSLCAPLLQSSFNYNHDNPALLPSAASASSSNGAGNHVVLMNNHISSMGGAARSNPGSSQLSGPYHHAHLEKQQAAGNYQQGFPQNENIIATTAAAGGGVLRRSKTGHDGDDDESSGNTAFFTCLVTFIAIILVAAIAFVVGLVTFRKRGRVSQSSSWCWWCVSKLGINGSSSSLPKCLSAPNSSSTNEGGGPGTPGRSGNSASGDGDYNYFSDQAKLFDGYFIYSNEDAQFVTEKLVLDLEQRNLRLCLHRDLCLAADNPWNAELVRSAGDASKLIFIVVSNNLFNFEWTNTHFRSCVHSVIQQHSKKVIIIKLPPVSDQIVSSICSFSSSPVTKLEYGDKNFWPKFRLLLPTTLPTSSSTGNNNNRTDTTTSNFPTISSHATVNSQLPYTTNLNHNFVTAASSNSSGPLLPYQIPMIASHHHHYHQPSDPVSTIAPPLSQQHPHFITMMNWAGQQQQQQYHQGLPSLPLSHSSSVHPIPSQLTPQEFGYSNIDGFPNNINSAQSILFSPQHQQQPIHFSSSNNNTRQSHRQFHSNLAHPHHNNHPGNHHNHHNIPPGQGRHIHSLSQLSNMSGCKSPVEGNYSSSAVSSGNEEFDHVYSTLDSPLESPCSDLGPGHVTGQFEGAIISGAQVNRHQIQHSTSSGISSGSDATSGTGGCHPGVGNGNGGGPPMYFV